MWSDVCLRSIVRVWCFFSLLVCFLGFSWLRKGLRALEVGFFVLKFAPFCYVYTSLFIKNKCGQGLVEGEVFHSPIHLLLFTPEIWHKLWLAFILDCGTQAAKDAPNLWRSMCLLIHLLHLTPTNISIRPLYEISVFSTVTFLCDRSIPEVG